MFDSNKGPLDLFIRNYFRHNHQLGSKDRQYLVEKIYTYFRWRLLLEELGADRDTLFDLLESNLYIHTSFPDHIRVSFPQDLFEAIHHTWKERAVEICLACNEQAPLTIRVNPLQGSREELLERLYAHSIQASIDDSAPFAITLQKRINVWTLPEFKEGWFEMQDAGSQRVAENIHLRPGQKFLDYCAGSGGKSLACAYKLEGRGQIFLHDIRSSALAEAKKRLKRAGIQNAQVITNQRQLRLLQGTMDWVLVDVPCSGTGTLRRNPDMKWKFSSEMVERLIQEQREIFAEALKYVQPGGRIVYATCSLLKEENENQVEYFLKTFPLQLEGEPFSSVPTPGGMDGFFAACFVKQ